MSVWLTFLGAAGTLTGTGFMLEGDRTRVLVDFGLYQGERTWRRLNWQPLAADRRFDRRRGADACPPRPLPLPARTGSARLHRAGLGHLRHRRAG